MKTIITKSQYELLKIYENVVLTHGKNASTNELQNMCESLEKEFLKIQPRMNCPAAALLILEGLRAELTERTH